MAVVELAAATFRMVSSKARRLSKRGRTGGLFFVKSEAKRSKMRKQNFVHQHPQASTGGYVKHKHGACTQQASSKRVSFAPTVKMVTFEADSVERSSKRIKSSKDNEYVRELEFFKLVRNWALSCSQASARYQDFDPIRIFFYRSWSRLATAVALNLSTFDDLVRQVEAFVNEHMYAPTLEEVSTRNAQCCAEQIITSLVADWLAAHFYYDLDKQQDVDDLCHDVFHIACTIAWMRQTGAIHRLSVVSLA